MTEYYKLQIVKIILVHNFYQQPGGEDVVFQQERELLERAGHDVVTYCRSNREVDSYLGVKRLVLLRKTIWAEDTLKEFAELLRMRAREIQRAEDAKANSPVRRQAE